MTPLPAVRRLEAAVAENPWLDRAIRHLDGAGLPDAWVVAGAVAQTVWNLAAGLPADHGIRDLDVVYCDAADLSPEAELRQGERLADRLGPLPVALDVKNQARVHLWYEGRFGRPTVPYLSTAAAIATYPTTATALGVRRCAGRFEVCAPMGLDDLFALIVRPNPILVSEDAYAGKARRWGERWPALKILPWPGQQASEAR